MKEEDIDKIKTEKRKVETSDNLKNFYTVQINYRSSDGTLYEGSVTFKRRTILDISETARIQSFLNGDGKVSPVIDQLNEMIAYLKVAVVSAPAWFKMDEIYDVGLIGELYSKGQEWENSFFRVKGGDKSPQEDSKEESEQLSGATS